MDRWININISDVHGSRDEVTMFISVPVQTGCTHLSDAGAGTDEVCTCLSDACASTYVPGIISV